MTSDPVLSHVIPGWSENRWSDLLACLIATDPEPIGRFVGTSPTEVRREVSVRGAEGTDRLDLLLSHDGDEIAAIEAKVLSDLGRDQLARYTAAYPRARQRFVLHLRTMPASLLADSGWSSLTWEDVLEEYARSTNTWVATTAQAWLRQIDTLIPHVDGATVWNDVPDDYAQFNLAMRARMAWLAHAIDPLTDLDHDLLMASGGGPWVLRLWLDTSVPGLRVQAEMQEAMTAFTWRFDPANRYRDRLRGPAPLIALRLADVDSSASFDWRRLHHTFAATVLDPDGRPRPDWPWQTSSASPRDPVDRAHWRQMVAAGGPRWLGKGFGMAVAQKYGDCLFGARMQLAPSLTMDDVLAQVLALDPLIRAMAEAASAAPDSLSVPPHTVVQ